MKLIERVGCSKSGVLLLHREPGVDGVPGLQERAHGTAGGGGAPPHASPSGHSLRFGKTNTTFFVVEVFVEKVRGALVHKRVENTNVADCISFL
jgi:hypothetical protein